jgi:glycosyltransferase involved in cell wall biosynthesis
MAITNRLGGSASPPHVVVDVRMLRHAGIGTYIRNVVPRVVAARPEWRFTLLSARQASPDWTLSDRERVRRCSSDIYSIGEQIELPLKTPRTATLFWSPHYNVPVFSRAPLVVTVHDVCHLAMPEVYGGAARGAYARYMFDTVRRRAREIVFDSDFTRTEFVRHVGEPARSTTALLGVDRVWRTANRSPRPHPRPYVLFVGSGKPHKNLVALIKAFDMSRVTLAGHDLVLLGSFQRQRTIDDDALGLASALGARVRLVHDADDATVRAFVAGAAALVLPSLYEGFGLPALEAMAAGCPCLVSNVASLPEVCGDGALYCDPRDPGDIARQLVRLVSDGELRTRLVHAGRLRADRFDWDITAERTASVLDRALASQGEVS